MRGHMVAEHLEIHEQILEFPEEIREMAARMYMLSVDIRCMRLNSIMEGSFVGVPIGFAVFLVLIWIGSRNLNLAIVAGLLLCCITWVARTNELQRRQALERSDYIRQLIILSQQPGADEARIALNKIGIRPFDPSRER